MEHFRYTGPVSGPSRSMSVPPSLYSRVAHLLQPSQSACHQVTTLALKKHNEVWARILLQERAGPGSSDHSIQSRDLGTAQVIDETQAQHLLLRQRLSILAVDTFTPFTRKITNKIR